MGDHNVYMKAVTSRIAQTHHRKRRQPKSQGQKGPSAESGHDNLQCYHFNNVRGFYINAVIWQRWIIGGTIGMSDRARQNEYALAARKTHVSM